MAEIAALTPTQEEIDPQSYQIPDLWPDIDPDN